MYTRWLYPDSIEETGKVKTAEGCDLVTSTVMFFDQEQKVSGSRHATLVDIRKATGYTKLFEGGVLIMGMPWCAKGDDRKTDEATR